MIGCAYPYKDTGWSIIEQGRIAPNLKMQIDCYLIANRRGETVHQEPTREQAEQWLENHLKNFTT